MHILLLLCPKRNNENPTVWHYIAGSWSVSWWTLVAERCADVGTAVSAWSCHLGELPCPRGSLAGTWDVRNWCTRRRSWRANRWPAEYSNSVPWGRNFWGNNIIIYRARAPGSLDFGHVRSAAWTGPVWCVRLVFADPSWSKCRISDRSADPNERSSFSDRIMASRGGSTRSKWLTMSSRTY